MSDLALVCRAIPLCGIIACNTIIGANEPHLVEATGGHSSECSDGSAECAVGGSAGNMRGTGGTTFPDANDGMSGQDVMSDQDGPHEAGPHEAGPFEAGPLGCGDTTASIANCGACGHACAGFKANWQCTNSSCAVASCIIGWDDCDGLPGNGCEHDITADPANCGRCLNACPSGECVASSCRPLLTFGTDLLESSTQSIAGGNLSGVRVSVTASGALKKIGIGSISSGVKAYLAVYADNSGSPSTRIVTTAEQTLSAGVNEFEFGNVTITAGTYWILFTTSALLNVAASTSTTGWFIVPFAYGEPPSAMNLPIALTTLKVPTLFVRIVQH